MSRTGERLGAGAADERRAPGLDAARLLDQVADDRRGGRQRAGALAEEHRLAHRVADHVDGVVDAVDAGERVGVGDHGGMHAHVDALGSATPDREKLDGVAHLGGVGDVLGSESADSLGGDLAHHHAAVERDGAQDRDLGGGVEAVDVGGRVGLREALGLRLGERGRVVETVGGHAREHVVGGAVHDAHDRLDLVAGQRVLERADDRDAAADARLEEDVDAVGLGRLHDLFAVAREQRLVGGDDALAGVQRRKHDLARDTGPADELDDDVERVVGDHVVPVVRALLGGKAEIGEALGGAVGEARQLDVDARAAAEVLAVARQNLDDAGSNGSQSDQADSDGAHDDSSAFRGRARSAQLPATIVAEKPRPPGGARPDTVSRLVRDRAGHERSLTPLSPPLTFGADGMQDKRRAERSPTTEHDPP